MGGWMDGWMDACDIIMFSEIKIALKTNEFVHIYDTFYRFFIISTKFQDFAGPLAQTLIFQD